MERMFSKPFVASLEGHVDSVGVVVRKPGELGVVASGSGDGGAVFLFLLVAFLVLTHFHRIFCAEIILHDLPQRRHIMRVQAHKGMLTGLCFTGESGILSCGLDKTVKMWNVSEESSGIGSVEGAAEAEAGPSEVSVFFACGYFEVMLTLYSHENH
jgi:WD repeat and SOF domain-containing protein 1